MVGMKTGTSTVENSMEHPQRNKNRNTIKNSTYEFLPKGKKIMSQRDTWTSMFTAPLSAIAKKQCKHLSMDVWMEKM